MLLKKLSFVLCIFLSFSQLTSTFVFSTDYDIEIEPINSLNISYNGVVTERAIESLYEEILCNDLIMYSMPSVFDRSAIECTPYDYLSTTTKANQITAIDQITNTSQIEEIRQTTDVDQTTESASPDEIIRYTSAIASLQTLGNEGFTIVDGILVRYDGVGGEITIPNTVVEIGNNAFNGNKNITGIVFTQGLKRIGDYAFNNANVSGELIMPSSLEYIGHYAFAGCRNITGLKLQKGLKEIGNYAFSDCGKLSGKLSIPDTVTSIGQSAFYQCSFLTGDLIIPDSVTKIGMMAFMGCIGLNGELKLSTKLTTISSYAFARCFNIKGTVTIPDSVTSLGDYIFYESYSINEIVFGQGLATLYTIDGFYGCTGIESIVFTRLTPPTVTLWHFSTFPNLKTIYVPPGSLDVYIQQFTQYTPKTVAILPAGSGGGVQGKDYAVSLSQTGTYVFPLVNQGYEQPAFKAFTVTNIGNAPTGTLTISISGSGASAFILSATQLSSLGVSGVDSFSIIYKSGLSQGVYTATVAVSGSSNIYAAFNVSLEIGPPPPPAGYSFGLGILGTFTFDKLYEGYGAGDIQPKAVQIANLGSLPTGPVEFALSGSGASSFVLSQSNIANIPPLTINTFTIAPKLGLAKGAYSATLTASGNYGVKESFSVMLTVDPPITHKISLDISGTYDFPTLKETYPPESIPSKLITITNAASSNTGTLMISLYGSSAGSFALSTGSLPSLNNLGDKASFTVSPKPGLTQGLYTAIIAVSGAAGIYNEFTVRLNVEPPPKQSISLSVGSTLVFNALTEGYTGVESRIVTVTNTGEANTGSLTLALSGSNANAFSLSKQTLTGLNPGSKTDFSIAPKIGLTAGSYSADLIVSGSGVNARLSISIIVSQQITPKIIINSNDYEFPTLTTGYTPSSLTVKTFQIINTGSQPTGQLTASIEGTTVFSVSPNTISSIAAGAASNISVAPSVGLPAGFYAGTLKITGGNGLTASIGISLWVKSPASAYSITLDVSGTHTFAPQNLGYGSGILIAKSVRITNNGTQPTGALTITLSGSNASAFTLSASSTPSLLVNASSTFTVIPKTGLATGTYTASVNIKGSNSISAGFSVSFTVNPAANYKIMLDTSGTYTYPVLNEGYSAANTISKTINVTNNGSQPTGSLSISITGNSSAFSLSKTSISSLAVNKSDSFAITPKTNLLPGIYNAKVTISGGNGINASFDIKLEINKNVNPPQITLIPISEVKTIIVNATGFLPNEELTILVAINRAPTQQNNDSQQKVFASSNGALAYGIPVSITQSLNWNGANVCYVSINGFTCSITI